MGNDGYNTLEDLVFSSSFRNWVLKGDTPESDFWMDWQARHPDKTEMINQAKAIIYALQLNLRPLADDAVNREIERVLEKLHQGRFNLSTQGEGGGPGEGRRQRRGRAGAESREQREGWGATGGRELPDDLRTPRLRRYSRVWAAAAIFAGLAIAVWSVRFYLHRQQDGLRAFIAGHRSAPIQQRTGGADSTHVLVLPDGSTVRLGPGSKLYYPEKLTAANTAHGREVYLQGDAFFDVAHDASNPFVVYTHQLVTKVLGTSFRISTGEDARTIVAVSSGKVSVYRNGDFRMGGAAAPGGRTIPAEGVILTPNQQIVYDPAEDRLDRSVTARPQMLTGTSDTSLLFNSTPLATVFHRLQSIYGIPIIYDEESVSGCSLSVTMGNETFFEKLNIICKAIGATYESIDGTIVVSTHGGGCK